LRNIELVKSLGLAQQEIARLNSTTAKILKLELKKVRYLRSLSFVQGTCVNLLRTSILFLMLYLIFTQRITVGQFFSLFIYSFFIFGPLQELGNVINIYRETEVSLQNFEAILQLPPEPRPERPVTVPSLDTLRFDSVSFQHQTASAPALREISFRVDRGETIAFVGPSGAGKVPWSSCWWDFTGQRPSYVLQRNTGRRSRHRRLTRADRICDPGCAVVLRVDPENLLFVQPQATDEECLNVLRQASVEGLLLRAGRGLDTVIGEAGVKVSGGESSGWRSPGRSFGGHNCWYSTRLHPRSIANGRRHQPYHSQHSGGK